MRLRNATIRVIRLVLPTQPRGRVDQFHHVDQVRDIEQAAGERRGDEPQRDLDEKVENCPVVVGGGVRVDVTQSVDDGTGRLFGQQTLSPVGDVVLRHCVHRAFIISISASRSFRTSTELSSSSLAPGIAAGRIHT